MDPAPDPVPTPRDPAPGPRQARPALLLTAGVVGVVAGSALTLALVRPGAPAPAAVPPAPPEVAKPAPPEPPVEAKPALRAVEPTADEVAGAARLGFARTFEFNRPAIWCLIREHNHLDADEPVYRYEWKIVHPGDRLTIVGYTTPVVTPSFPDKNYRVGVLVKHAGVSTSLAFADPKGVLRGHDTSSWSASSLIEGKVGEAYTLCQFGWARGGANGGFDFNMSHGVGQPFWPLVAHRPPDPRKGVGVRWSLRVLFIELRSDGALSWPDDHLRRFLDTEGLIRGARESFLRQELDGRIGWARENPSDAASANHVAWVSATAPFPCLRDGRRAVQHATRACELVGWKSLTYLETLVAAHAEAGEFDKAVEWQRKVLDAPNFDKVFTPGQQATARERHLLYLEGKPWHAP